VAYQSGCGNEDRWLVGRHLIEADTSRGIPVNQPIVCSTSKWNVHWTDTRVRSHSADSCRSQDNERGRHLKSNVPPSTGRWSVRSRWRLKRAAARTHPPSCTGAPSAKRLTARVNHFANRTFRTCILSYNLMPRLRPVDTVYPMEIQWISKKPSCHVTDVSQWPADFANANWSS